MIVSRYVVSMRGACSDFVPGALGACSFFAVCCLALAMSLLGLRLAHALVGLLAVPADERPSAGLEHGVLGAGRPAAVRAHEHDVGVVERGLEVDDAALRDLDAAAPLARLLVALEDVDALDHDLVLLRDGAQDLALLALVLAGDDDHGVARRELEPLALGLLLVL